MKRYPAYDPPEYVNWQPNREVSQHFKATLSQDPTRKKLIKQLTVKELLALYRGLLCNRLHDIALKRWVKLGVISKAWLGTGEEAVTIGSVHALNREIYPDGYRHDFVAPMIRNSGACHEMGMSLADMLRGYLATADSPTGGRDLHIGSIKDGILAPISHVGDIVAVCGGVALKFKLHNQPRLVLTWVGDGSTKTGVFHEALNFAAVKQLPMIIIIQNNQIALGTKLDQHHRGDFKEWPESYGVWGTSFDGNNVLDAYAATRLAAERVRKGQGPALLIAETFRMGGHATHDEDEARKTFDPQLFSDWGQRDPIGCYESYLIESGLDLTQDGEKCTAKERAARNQLLLESIEEAISAEVDQATEEALASRRDQQVQPESALVGVYR